MNSPKSCRNRSIQDPWSIQKRLNLRLRDNSEARAREGMDDEAASDLRTEYDRNSADGNRTFEVADHTFNIEAKKKKAFLDKSLRQFQAATGINEEKYLARIEEAKSLGELKKLETQFRRAGATYYKQQIERSGLYIEMDHREKAIVNDEKKMCFSFIENPKLPFNTDDTDEPSMVEALCELKGHLEERRKGRQRLSSQSAYVKNEFFRQLETLGPTASKEKLLDKILKKVGNLEKEPSAIQVEFKKASKAVDGSKDTETVLKEVREEYDKRVGEYNGLLAENQAYFGGKEVSTPNGKKRSALVEFEKWFAGLNKFSEMEAMKEKFFSVVLPERIKVYSERDEMLAALPEGKRAVIRQKTDEMRLHTLKAYLKESESTNMRESVFAMEYMASLESAELDGYPLFSGPEKDELKGIIQKSSAELQEAELKVLLGRMIPEREQVAADYLALNDHLKDDHRFFTANIYEKRKMLRDSKEKENRELKNPFDIDSLPVEKEDKMSLLLTKLNSAEGQRAVQEKRKGLTQDGKTQRVDTQMKIMNVMSGQWAEMQKEGTTQVENYMQQIYKGARVNNKNLWRGAWEEGVARDDNQKYMAETARTDYRAYLAGRARTWGGKSVEVGRVTKGELEKGSASMLDKFGKALYPENMLFLNAEGADDLKPAETGAEVMEDSLRAELIVMLDALGLDLNDVPRDFKEALIQLAIVGENGGLFSRMSRLTGGTNIVEEAVN